VKVHLTATACRHLRAIHDYIAKDSAHYADRMVDRILRCAQQLADFPMLGAVVEKYEQDDVREILQHPYRIIYRVKPDQVDVLAVIHGARQLPRSLES
jgi:toxin ParE1/3/4